MSNKIAFFDLDRTLIPENSALLFARYERRAGRISLWQLLETMFWMVLYHFSVVDIERAYGKAVMHYKGISEKELEDRVTHFFETEVGPKLLDAARERLNYHRNLGHKLVIVTSSSSYQAKLACQAWGFDDWLANRYHTGSDGALLGTYYKPFCYGQGKVTIAKEWCRQNKFSFEGAYFYSDSYTDLPLMEVVDNPIVVNGDPKLLREGRNRGWPVLDWSPN